MPFFKSTLNILKQPEEDEVFKTSWMDSDKLVLPPKPNWSYDREMAIEDVDIWEVLYEASHGLGLYAAWCPYAEFYLITTGLLPKKTDWQLINDRSWETYYGQGAQKKVLQRCNELEISVQIYKNTWVDEDKAWLYQNTPSEDKKIILI